MMPVIPILTEHSVHKFIVLGIGNVLMRDDGIGIHVVRELIAQADDHVPGGDTIQYLDGGTQGFLLVDRISGADGLVIVDATEFQQEPGSVRVFTDQALQDFLRGKTSSSVHEAGLIDLLDMMSLNQQAPRLQTLVGIQPESVDWGMDLSPALLPSVATAAQQVRQVLTRWSTEIQEMGHAGA